MDGCDGKPQSVRLDSTASCREYLIDALSTHLVTWPFLLYRVNEKDLNTPCCFWTVCFEGVWVLTASFSSVFIFPFSSQILCQIIRGGQVSVVGNNQRSNIRKRVPECLKHQCLIILNNDCFIFFPLSIFGFTFYFSCVDVMHKRTVILTKQLIDVTYKLLINVSCLSIFPWITKMFTVLILYVISILPKYDT